MNVAKTPAGVESGVHSRVGVRRGPGEPQARWGQEGQADASRSRPELQTGIGGQRTEFRGGARAVCDVDGEAKVHHEIGIAVIANGAETPAGVGSGVAHKVVVRRGPGEPQARWG